MPLDEVSGVHDNRFKLEPRRVIFVIDVPIGSANESSVESVGHSRTIAYTDFLSLDEVYLMQKKKHYQR